ncbi:hypothetical protein A3A01_00925 [Candidatus Nomurabacteria bacterium RIFCSPLOWO2_01_FULL_39_17]|uniref:Baseplate protein J-like domain-containing protein n=1 Tax=Candidatus Nomurabacteria bacterium RIFCSPLOWO2_01_FULL_39_17 TaxID=1801770 RepID=A0A1F6WVR6_9BACT|nr:MAG: hypothetical protein A3A01_00925 [Candidatus Nomurabacteria bacterium RIFCSPLOWO2_01_FULL_39_17]
MPRNLLQDVIRVKKKVQNPDFKLRYTLDENKFLSSKNIINQASNKNKPKYKLWFVALISVVFLLFALSFLFARAKITVMPKTQNISLNQNLSAVKNGNDSNALSFDLVVISGEEEKTIQGGELKDVSVKARGTVVIYNNFSSSSQVLAKDTRLEGSNGKIYQIISKITVPGIKNGKPGSVEVSIYAALAGEEYNSAPLDFKILGFKGTSKYSKFYGRSKGDITEGLRGKYYQISNTQKATLNDELKTALSAKLFQKVTAQIPPGFILFKDAGFLNIDENNINNISPESSQTDGMIKVIMKGTFYGFLFDEKKLTKMIAENSIDQYDDSDIHIPDIKNLIFSLPDKEISFADVKNINFNLSGASQIVWNVDSSKLVNDLLGKRKKDFTQILSAYPNITSADVTFRPFWVRSFPDKEKNIKLIIEVY